MQPETSKSTEIKITELYNRLLESWNNQDAHTFASLFAENANVVGFDGSQMDGKRAIENELSQIFNHHKTASYVSKIREIRFLSSDVAILRAVAGMVPPGDNDIKPEVNAIQSLVATSNHDGDWKIALFQNTPAQFHGRPELQEALTNELRNLL
jgi:uncharacterized protein (TIGR02246 family)